jgi:SAM-dependent methyltransferase
VSEAFDAGWLALREGYDAAARSRPLAQHFVDRLPPRPRLLDLGAGTGSLFRWLAPMIRGAQRWTLVDADPALLDAALAMTAGWAARRGWTVTFPGRAMLVHAPGGAWRIEAIVADLAELAALPFGDTDAVACSALLDLVSAPWLAELAEMLRTPFYATLSVTGQHRFLPPHPGDRRIEAAFRRDQSRDKGVGPALGARASGRATTLLAARGFAVRAAPSDWRIPRGALTMLRALVEGTADAARRAAPRQAPAIDTWEAARLRQAIAGRLAIRVGHRDILARPGGH